MSWKTPEVPSLDLVLDPVLRAAIDQKTKPLGALGELEQIARRIGLIQGTVKPALNKPTILVFAGDHGLADEGVSPYPKAVTAQMVLNFLGGGAAINVFARQHGLELIVVDAGVASDLPTHPRLRAEKIGRGTRSALREPAMTQAELDRALEAGAKLVRELSEGGTNAVLLGEMGIGNTSAATLMVSALLPSDVADSVGRGAGHDDAGMERKLDILRRVQARHGKISKPLEALRVLGGYEIAMLVGVILEAASRRFVIVNDGFISTAALLVAARLRPAVLEYTFFAHVSAEAAHRRVVSALGGRPLLDLGMRLGEGSGGAVAWPLLVSAVKFLNEMATFASAGVSERST